MTDRSRPKAEFRQSRLSAYKRTFGRSGSSRADDGRKAALPTLASTIGKEPTSLRTRMTHFSVVDVRSALVELPAGQMRCSSCSAFFGYLLSPRVWSSFPHLSNRLPAQSLRADISMSTTLMPPHSPSSRSPSSRGGSLCGGSRCDREFART